MFHKERVQGVVDIINPAEAVALFLILVVFPDGWYFCHDGSDTFVDKWALRVGVVVHGRGVYWVMKAVLL